MDPEIIITNLKRTYTGVSGTISALLPIQVLTKKIAFVGKKVPGVELAKNINPENFIYLSIWQAIKISLNKSKKGSPRIWHVRRDHEMILTIFMRDVLRMPIKIIFTSAAKHKHSWFPRWLISKMDGVIATTEEAAKLVPNTIKIISHGANLNQFKYPNNKLNIWQRTGFPGKYGIGIFGRVRPSKGTDFFVKAMIELLPLFPEFTAVIIGKNSFKYKKFKKGLENLIEKSSLNDRIFFLGELSDNEIPYWYQNITIMVACPRYEPFGITPLEAMACGCAVVATKTGAFEKIISNNETGIIVPVNNLASLIIALKELMSDPNKIENMGVNGLNRVASFFSVEKEAENINEVYKKILLKK